MTVPRSRLPNSGGNALVLAGGGVAGIAWELGVLCGIADADPALAGRVLAANIVVGTSAGAAVAAQITCGVPLDELVSNDPRLGPDCLGLLEPGVAVSRRTTPGGGGPIPVARQLDAAREHLAEQQVWLER